MIDSDGDPLQTIHMFDQQHLDIRTITMGISLLDCADPRPEGCLPEDLRQDLPAAPNTWWPPARPSRRSSASPSSTSASPSPPSPWWPRAATQTDYAPFAAALDRAAKTMRRQLHRRLLRPGAEGVRPRPTGSSSPPSPRPWPPPTWCAPRVNVGSTKAGINMDAVALMGRIIKETADRTADGGAASAAPSWWCSATPWRTTPSWPAPSTAWASRTASSTWASPAPAWCYHALQQREGPAL